MALTKIRTTNRPLDEIEVEDSELLDLQRLGIVLDSRATTDDGLQRAAVEQVENRAGNATPTDDTEGASV